MTHIEKLKPQRVGFYIYHDKILGKGNFATVYLAHHKVIGCDVALKVINVDDIEEEYVSKNLNREARILRDLHHPNIVRLYETVKTLNLYCLSMERIRGMNLGQYMRKQENCRLSEKNARTLFYQMLSAVEYLHLLNIIHRDLKQENILVEFGHIIKIVDFGLSNVYYPCYQPRTHCGSVEYAAPELFIPQSPYGTQADLWSLGVILYAMVVGKMPFVFGIQSSDDPESSQKREIFIQRISKGLIQENWELMEDLSPDTKAAMMQIILLYGFITFLPFVDCWNLLHDLLLPDQFRRIHIADALKHHWIKKDNLLKKRLPQFRRDLRRKFHNEIIQFLADKLDTSYARVEKHVSQSQGGKITCMFHIICDTLVKDVLYPPKNFANSFLYQFEYWRQHRSSLLSVYEHYRVSDYNECKKDVIHSHNKLREADSVPEILKVKSCDAIKQVTSRCMQIKENAKCPPFNPENANHINLEQTSEGINHSIISSKGKESNADDNNVKLNTKNVLLKNVYRSYKNSRPNRMQFCPSEKKIRSKVTDMIKEPKTIEKIEYCSKRIDSLEEQPKTQTTDKFLVKHILEENPIPNIQVLKVKSREDDKVKLKTSRIANDDGFKQNIIKIQTRCKTIAKDHASDSKSIEVKQKETANIRTIKNENNREDCTLERTTENDFNLLTRKKSSASNPGKSDDRKKTFALDFPSRIPTKDIRYGPPATFFHSPNSAAKKIRNIKIKSRPNVADRISNRGDTNESLP